MNKNVLIPRSTLERIIELMECLDISRLPNYYDYIDILRELKVKTQKLKLREAYAEIIRAGDTDANFDARIEYLRLKHQVGNVDV